MRISTALRRRARTFVSGLFGYDVAAMTLACPIIFVLGVQILRIWPGERGFFLVEVSSLAIMGLAVVVGTLCERRAARKNGRRRR